MQVHILTERWGDRPSEFSATPYANREHAESDFRTAIRQNLDGSNVDIDAAVTKATESNFEFRHSEGYIVLETVGVREPT